jgi:hypothetical protein
MMRSAVLLAACMAIVACSGGPPAVTPSAEPTASEPTLPAATQTPEAPSPTTPAQATEPPAVAGLYAQNQSDGPVIVLLRGGLRREVVVPAGRTGLVADGAALQRPSDDTRVDVYDGRCRRRLDRLGVINEAVMLVQVDRRRNSRLLAGADARAVAQPGVAALQVTDRC